MFRLLVLMHRLEALWMAS